MKRSLTIGIVAIVFAIMLLPTSLNLQTSNAASLITVPTDYPTIQSAIDAANPGDSIKVLPGTYTEQLTISKSLTLIGSGAKVTIIKAPAVLQDTNAIGQFYVVDINSGAEVVMKGLAVSGLEGLTCVNIDLAGISVMEEASLNLGSAAVNGCTQHAIFVGAPPFVPNGPQVGDATVTRTSVTDYRDHGILAAGEDSTLKVSYSNLVGAENSEVPGMIGLVADFGAKGIFDHNKVSRNLCDNPACGPDFLTQFQAFGVVLGCADVGSVISFNDVSNNDAGIGVFGNSVSCKVDHNTLTKNRFFGAVVGDGEQTISNTKISGGNVGVLAVAFEVDTVATLNRIIITGTTTPTQELPVGATAEVVFAPRSAQIMQSTTTLTDNPVSFVLPAPAYEDLSS